ncbi:AraC family transcriptional regulator [Paenibacillus kobensis]|uniref:AraC family transcriptional regulator n=1 Tax=Paenibacillus kobensis TaxID=59841 RepID=UPI0013E3AECE|nr:AraC family transcriptional regulator [Paenibacillus kobensis]
MKITCISEINIFPNGRKKINEEDGYYLVHPITDIKLLSDGNEIFKSRGQTMVCKSLSIVNDCNDTWKIKLITFSLIGTGVEIPTLLSLVELKEIRELLEEETSPSLAPNEGYEKLERLIEKVVAHLPIKTNEKGSSQSARILSGFIDSRLLIVNRYIRKGYKEAITLDILGKLIHCNPVYLSNTYSKVFGIPPIKYLQLVRIEATKNLLVQTTDSIKEISTQVGYLSTWQLNHYFKRTVGITPIEYRLKHSAYARKNLDSNIEPIHFHTGK